MTSPFGYDFGETTMASPYSSYCGRPALPHSCLYSSTLIGVLRPSDGSYRSMLDTTTRRAGRLTPAASVGVEASSLMRLARNAASTSERAACARPAWWNATPLRTRPASAPASLVPPPDATMRSAALARCPASGAPSAFETGPAAFSARDTERALLSANSSAWPPSRTASMPMSTGAPSPDGFSRRTSPSLIAIDVPW